MHSYLRFRLASLHSVPYFFLLYQSPSSSLCTVFDAISSNTDEFLSVNPSANVFVFGNFNVHHKDCLTHSGGNDRPGELYYDFSILNDLILMVTFLLKSLSVTLIDLLSWIYFFLLMPYNGFPLLGNSY